MSLESQFDPILKKCFRDGDEYRKSPPKGPPLEYPALSQEDIDALSLTEHGEDYSSALGEGAYSKIELLEIPPKPMDIPVPSVDELADTYVCGIDGSNQRVQRGGFHFILCRAAMVAFRYSKIGQKPYFYRLQKDATAVVWVDGNIFEDRIRLNTHPHEGSSERNILSQLEKNITKPLMYRYDTRENRPSEYALGVAVKIMQGLELLCIKETPLNAKHVVCIKDGPLFSASTTPRDVRIGLEPLFNADWDENCTYVACSKRVRDSTLLLEALLSRHGGTLRDFWFPEQNIIDRTIRELPSDSVLLPRILKPGQRTPLMAATPIARKGIVAEDKRLEPLSCYYLSRTRPHTYVRLEIPRFMWDRSKDSVEYAIKITAWQHELGRTAPLVLNMADEQCDISHERRILEWRTDAALQIKKLDLLQDYHA